MLGYIGMSLLLIAYVLLIIKPVLFIPVDIVASALLTAHAYTLGDYPFIIVNGFITGLLTYKMLKKEQI